MGGKVIENESKLILDDDLIEPPPPLNDGGSPNVGGQVLKKGPWTAAEDRILEEYVKKHGEGNWNVVQRQSGLSRCGKSCRLRWSNHLRPNLKKGALSPEEEKKVAILHAMMGNKWSRIIAYLPGRTDNEIKNYWNTRRKKSQRFGTPLYPLGVSLPAKDDKKQSESVSMYDDYSVKQPNELLCGNGLDDSTITFDDFNGSHDAISYPPLFPDVSADHILTQGFGGENYGLACQVVDGVNQLIGSENMIHGYHSSVSSVLPSLEQFPVDPSPNMNQSFGLGYPYNPDPSFQTPAFAGGAGCGSHVLLPNDNFSYSGPLSGSVKLEFPSIQFSNSDGSQWLSKASTTFEASNGRINFPPNQYSDSNGSQWLSQVATPFQETGACIESPSMEVSFRPDLGLPINIAMLDSLVYVVLEESRSRNLSAEFPENISNHSVIVPNNTIENSGPDPRETDWWEGDKDPESPLGPSVASIFDESAPPSLADILPLGHNSENVLPIIEQVSRQNVVGKDLPPN